MSNNFDFCVGFGYDSHRLADHLPFRLAGVDIPFSKGCVAHSDGDVVIHALCDALLGAAALQDIGTHFPDNNPEFKNIDSTILLEKTVLLIQQNGWFVNNVDITIILEQPKLASYKLKMQSVLAHLLQVSENVVSIKAKTNEKMGFIGAGEGVAVTAVVTIRK